MTENESVQGANTEVLCLIPARRGSKGLPGKNTRVLQGKPLIAWTIECAKHSGIFGSIVVSTDDESVKEIAHQYGVSILNRPESLALDSSRASDYLSFHFDYIKKFRFIFLLQPTSPLRQESDLIKVLGELREQRSSLSSIVAMTDTNFRFSNLFHVSTNGEAHQLTNVIESNRQDELSVYSVNGAIFAAATSYLQEIDFRFLGGKVTAYLMPKERSIDIDSLEDFELASRLMSKGIE
jgi:CMP-N,N'-diacetyllegionaminic acid synthase